MPTTVKQRRAVRAAYGIAKRGGTPRTFKNMSQAKRRQWAKAPIHKKGKSKSTRSSSHASRR